MMYQKLVRDNIPAIIEKNGATCVTRKLTDKEYEDALTNKLQEEVAELLEAYTAKERSALDCAEEMADVMEVLYAMGKACAVSKREIEQVRSQKAAEKGTFSKKIFLVSTEKRREHACDAARHNAVNQKTDFCQIQSRPHAFLSVCGRNCTNLGRARRQGRCPRYSQHFP